MARTSSKADFGSLGAFMSNPAGVSTAAKAPSSAAGAAPPPLPSKRSGAKVAAAADASFPPRPQRDPFKDGTLLNRKVAFKMLKQLGCQVRQRASEEEGTDGGDCNDAGNGPEAVIEVRVQEQPVLFQMLLEFGYEPHPDADGVPSICVEQPRQRARDEVFAALAAPRPLKAPPMAEETLTPPRPRMTAQEKEDMVKRLSERRTAKFPPPVEEERAPRQESRFRNKSEQKAHLERLLRPRDYRASSNEEASSDDHHPAPTRSASMASPLGTWPQTTAERRVEASPSASTIFSRSRAARPSPLAQVGYMSLSTPGSGSSSRHSVSASSDGQPAAPRQDPCRVELPEGSSEVEGSKEMAAATAPAVEMPPAAAEVEECNQAAPSDSASAQGQDWLDSMLGPLQQWPGRTSGVRSRAEQQKRLQQLAKPREPKPQDSEPTAAPAPKRSPRAQREACSRLAATRAKKESAETADCSKDQAGAAHSCQDEVADELVSNGDSEEPQVVLIPSMLSQLSHGLDRIEEDTPAAGVEGSKQGGQGRRRQRASSMPAGGAAAPYAVPVFPASLAEKSSSSSSSSSSRRPPRGRSLPRRDAPADDTSGSLHELMVEDPEWAFSVIRDELGERGPESEDMLADIDKLYSALLMKSAGNTESAPARGRAQRGRAEGRGRAESLTAGPTDEFTTSHGLISAADILRKERASTHPPMPSYGKGASDDSGLLSRDKEVLNCPSEGGHHGGQDETLLANIDQLYNNLLQEGASSGCASTAEIAPDKDEMASCVEPAAQSPEEQSICELLTEVLWSALMLRRSLEGSLDVQSSLLELLPPPDLAQCFLICGPDSLTPSLMQRLGTELPAVLTAITCSTPEFGDFKSTSALLAKVREARDNLLTLAGSSAMSEQSEASGPPPAPAKEMSAESSGQLPKPKLKVRKTSLSHWTSECLANLEAPPKRITQRLVK